MRRVHQLREISMGEQNGLEWLSLLDMNERNFSLATLCQEYGHMIYYYVYYDDRCNCITITAIHHTYSYMSQ